MDARTAYAGIIEGLKAHLRLMELSGVDAFHKGPPDEGPFRRLLEDIKGCGKCPRPDGARRGDLAAGYGRPRAAFVIAAPPGEGASANGPFKGPEGELLLRIIKSMGLDKDDVRVCYALKCAAPDEKARIEDSALNCASFLERELDALKPEAVVLFGPVATLALLGRDGLDAPRGRFQAKNGLKVMPTHGLGSLLQSSDLKKEAWQDMQAVMKELGLSAPRT